MDNLLPVEAEELDNIKIRTTGLVLSRFNKFQDNFSKNLNASIDDLFISLGVKAGKYSRSLAEKAVEYNKLPEQDKLLNSHLYSQDELDIFPEIIQENNLRTERLLQAPIEIFRSMIKEGIEDDKPVRSFDEFLDLLSCASGISKERLFISDMYIWVEMFTRLWVKNKGEIGSSFFIVKATKKLLDSFPSLNSIAKKIQSTTKNISEI